MADMGAPADLKLVKEVPDNADLAIPCFTLSKALRMPPVAIAEKIAEKIETLFSLATSDLSGRK